MIYQELPIQMGGSMPYAKLCAYILDTPGEHIKVTKRPVIIFCPGGCYERTSFREGEPLVMHFLEQGYHACILRYSTAPARYPTALLELGMAMRILHELADEWKIDTDRIIVQGSSAGGHLAGCLGAFWNKPFLEEVLEVPSDMLKPKGLILSYPVITSNEFYMHKESFQNLLGKKYHKQREELSLEHCVSKDMPPCFIWHTGEDNTVPVENSLLLAMALRGQNIPVELHIFDKGAHGLSAATRQVQKPDGSGVQEECQCWTELACRWLSHLCV